MKLLKSIANCKHCNHDYCSVLLIITVIRFVSGGNRFIEFKYVESSSLVNIGGAAMGVANDIVNTGTQISTAFHYFQEIVAKKV